MLFSGSPAALNTRELIDAADLAVASLTNCGLALVHSREIILEAHSAPQNA